MSANGYDNHRCEGSLDAHCSIRRYPAQKLGYTYKDGHWHLFRRHIDFDWNITSMRNVVRIKYCPWCGVRL